MNGLLIPTLLCIPLVLFFAAVFAWKKIQKTGKKNPFPEPLPRPPGESCRQKLEELQDRLEDRAFIVLTTLGTMALFAFILAAGTSSITAFVFLIIGLAVAAAGFWWIRPIMTDLSNYRLGLQGEQVVGQALTALIAKGYRVFHDLQFEGFNIDHALVGPSGVYCIETKSRSKTLDVAGHKVVYDGRSLLFPSGEESWGLAQAERNAKTLSQWIAKSAAEKVMVHPVLVIPGWFVERKAIKPVRVLNHKEVDRMLPDEVVLTGDQIQRISHQLQQKSLVSF